MEKDDRPMRESDGVLGQLYKQVKDKEKQAVEAFVRQDYDKSIRQIYELDPMMVSYAHKNLDLFRHLQYIYQEIVKPMEQRLK